MTKPLYGKQILPVLWAFIIKLFHCTQLEWRTNSIFSAFLFKAFHCS